MALDRRAFLVRTGLTFAAGALASTPFWADGEDDAADAAASFTTWRAVREQFELAPRVVHLGLGRMAPHPAPVRRAIARHRAGLDRNPVEYLSRNQAALEARVLRAAAAYLGAAPADIALTDSTTMGLGLLYNGLELRAGQEILTTTHDFFATHEALRLKAARSGAVVRTIPLYRQLAAVSAEEIVESLVEAISARTRVMALT